MPTWQTEELPPEKPEEKPCPKCKQTARKLKVKKEGKNKGRDVREMLMEDGKTFEDVDLIVRRRGSGKDNTSYRIDIGKEKPLSKEDKDLIANKIDLDEYFKPTTPEQITRLLNGESWEKVMYEDNDENEEDFSLE